MTESIIVSGRVYMFVPREIFQTKIFHSCISGAHGAGIATLSPRGLEASLPPIP